jgi:hypothetical protein
VELDSWKRVTTRRPTCPGGRFGQPFQTRLTQFRSEHDLISFGALDHDSWITFAYYRELVKPKDAERYWNIRPAPVAKVVVPMTRESYAELKEHIRTAPIVKVEKFKPAKDAR